MHNRTVSPPITTSLTDPMAQSQQASSTRPQEALPICSPGTIICQMGRQAIFTEQIRQTNRILPHCDCLPHIQASGLDLQFLQLKLARTLLIHPRVRQALNMQAITPQNQRLRNPPLMGMIACPTLQLPLLQPPLASIVLEDMAQV